MIRRGRRKMWLVFSFLAAVVLAALVVRFIRDSVSIAPTVSKETTYITEPLRSDGYPDYLAALNRRLSEGVTPENNSAVLFWGAMGPSRIAKECRKKYFQMLGIPPLPENGDYFVPSDDFPARWRREKKLTEYKPDTDHGDPLWRQYELVMTRPWSKGESPAWADWLARNEKPLDLLVEASKRPRRFDPLLADDDLVVAVLLPAAQWHRDAARGLAMRAMRRVAEGRIDDAWGDLLACHRLARLVGQGAVAVESLVAITVEAIACRGDQSLLQHAKLTAAQAERMRDDLAKLPPMPKVADILDVGERITCLDSIMMVRRQGTAGLQSLAGGGKGQAGLSTDAAIDWNAILRMANAWYDRVVVGMRKSTRSERSKANDEILRDFHAEAAAKGWKTVLSAAVNPRDARSRTIGLVIMAMMLPAGSALCDAEGRSTMLLDETKLALALAAYRADNGSYPGKLADLVPKYIAEIPKDIFNNDADLHYARQGNGYLLYSVGPSGKDDGGRGEGDRTGKEDWDDLAVRVPAKP